MKEIGKNLILWLIVGVLLLITFNKLSEEPEARTLTYSQFISEIKNNKVLSVKIDGLIIYGTLRSGEKFEVIRPQIEDPDLIGDLFSHDVLIEGTRPKQQSVWLQIFISILPILLIIGLVAFSMRQLQNKMGGRGGPILFSKSKAKMLTEDNIKATFSDVAGVDEAKEEVQELVDFLRDPSKFTKLGGHIPKGILMVGAPGTGKTLLARAIAGEAKVPFFSISGSDFVEMFVGVGASRVRDMFEQAKKHSPCIIFIDEIDAVGRHRGAGLGGGHDEREQTLNQLLVEMDGFTNNEGVITIAATNRPDVLDPALLRPGRFDRQIIVPLPDIRGREQILNVHMREVPTAADVNTSVIARGTPGFSGADLANLINEATLFAARLDLHLVSMKEFEKAKDKIMMGAERNSMVMSEKEKRNTAYHEAGHAIVGLMMPEYDPVYKITIIPRGKALGVTQFLPLEDKYSHSKQYLISSIATLFGGRIAEEIILGPNGITTGASNDIERATKLARNMVTTWGLSDLGPLKYSDKEDSEVFLGISAGIKTNPLSEETTKNIDIEIRAIIDRCYTEARTIIEENIDKLHQMAEELIKHETLDSEKIKVIMRDSSVNDSSSSDASPSTATDSGSDSHKESNTDTNKDSDEKIDSNNPPIGRPASEH